jgi:lipopolysaccharide transport system permease protein
MSAPTELGAGFATEDELAAEGDEHAGEAAGEALGREVHWTPLRESLRQAWHCRHVISGLGARYITLKRPNFILGIWWFPIRLVFNSVALAFIFGRILSVPSAPGVPYFVFVTGGTMIWFLFDRGTRRTMSSFKDYRKELSTLSFPLILVPFASMAAFVVPLGFMVIFLAIVLLVYLGIDGTLYLQLPEVIWLAPIGLVWMILAAVVVGLLTGPIFIRARDIRQLFRLVLPFLMFVTPVVYPIESLSGTLQTVVLANPLTPPLLLFKQGVIGTAGPPAWSIASGALVTALALTGALWFTNRFGPWAVFGAGVQSEDDEDVLA